MKKHQFTGKLNTKAAAEGIKLAYENAQSLVDDAKLLFENKRYERSVALSVLALEEAGKATIIRSLLLSEEPEHLKKEWRNYRKHTAKNLAWILPDLVKDGARTLDDLQKIFDPQSDHGQILDNIKQLSFYTDIFSSQKWHTLKMVIDKAFAESIFLTAKLMVQIDRVMTSEAELELWIKYMKPTLNLGRNEMKQALKKCYEEAVLQGLIDRAKLKELTKFLG